MAIMSYFCFAFPMRLSVLITSSFVMIQTIIPIVYILIYDAKDIAKMCEEVQENIEDYSTNSFFDWFLEYVKTKADLVWLAILVFSILLFITCILSILGAIKKIKFLLLPFIIFELLRILVLLGAHIVYMMVIKSQIDLGLHIVLTCTGGFLILFLAYCWATSIALFQILTEVNSKKYQEYKMRAQLEKKEAEPKGITSIYTYSNQEAPDRGMFVKDFSNYNKKRTSFLIQ